MELYDASKVSTINMSRLYASQRRVSTEIILPAKEEIEEDIAPKHDADPIKSVEDINRISEYFIQRGEYRNNMLFIVGINFGLRISDLLQLRFGNLIDENYCFKTTFPILEKKTKNTRKVAKNRYISINEAVMEAVTLYLEHYPSRLDEYMFQDERGGKKRENKPIHRNLAERIIKDVTRELGIQGHFATHTLRKTFGYHQMLMSGNDPRKLLLLQKIYGHSSSMQTLTYIGVTMEEIEDSYMHLNLGSRKCYQRFSQMGESAV